MQYWSSSFALIILSLGLAACSGNTGRSDSLQAGELDEFSPFQEYRIGNGDVLSILVWQQPEMTRRVTVRPDGMISFPFLGDLAVAGLTPQELRYLLVQELEEYLDTLPEEVSVVVEEIHSYTVSVLGEVNLPGKYPVNGPVTVLDVLAQAGGMTEFAASSRIQIFRNEQGVMRRIRFNYGDALSSQPSAERMRILPGDIVLVP